MLKRVIAIILILMSVLLCVSCNKKANDENATIQIWCYDFEDTGYYSSSLSSVLANAKLFCDKNRILLEINRYNEKTISYEDYILKRNAATANGNIIILEDARYTYDIAEQHADYSTLENYNSLFSAYKDKYCIPLAIGYRANVVNNNAINYYGINTDKSFVTYNDYLDIKQQMKEKGARFRLNEGEYIEILDFYLNKNGLRFVNEDNEIIKNNNKFKESLKNSIIGICDEFIQYYDSSFNIVRDDINGNYAIYDEFSELMLTDYKGSYFITSYSDFVNFGYSIMNYTLTVNPSYTFMSPCFYMHKKITNNKIYDLANYIVNENSYLYATDQFHTYSPVFDGEETRKILEVDDNWQYVGEFKTRVERGLEIDRSKKICNLIDNVYETLVRNEESSKLVASYYYSNKDYYDKFIYFVDGLTQELSSKNYDYKNEEINKMIDIKIDEFVTNFNVHYN